jgi:hypothetical protein
MLSLVRIVTSRYRGDMTTFIAAPTRHNGYDFVAVLVKDAVLTNRALEARALPDARDRDRGDNTWNGINAATRQITGEWVKQA